MNYILIVALMTITISMAMANTAQITGTLKITGNSVTVFQNNTVFLPNQFIPKAINNEFPAIFFVILMSVTGGFGGYIYFSKTKPKKDDRERDK